MTETSAPVDPDSPRTLPAISRASVVVFAGVCIVLAIALAAYLVRTADRQRRDPRRAADSSASGSRVIGPPPSALDAGSWLLFRNTGLTRAYGSLGVVSLSSPHDTRRFAPFQCDRVHFANNRGVCLTADRGVFTTYTAVVFDARFTELRRVSLAGMPSRTRVSPDGRYAAVTVFVTGHAYDQAGFSTRTTLLNAADGTILAEDLEQFSVERDGTSWRAPDFNFWGVTFERGSDVFFATLGSGGHEYLVKGSISGRRVAVLRQGVECPSLSPDGTRLVYKKRVFTGFRLTWRLHLLDLRTMGATPLAETRTVDDQVEWLDNEHVLYALPDANEGSAESTIWTLRADGSGTPQQFLGDGYSPVVVRN
jgi:hypothetical protein